MPEDKEPVNYDVPKDDTSEDSTEGKGTSDGSQKSDFVSHEPETPPLHPELAITKPTKTPSIKKKKIIIAVIAIVVLAGAAAAYLLYFKKDPAPANNSSSQVPAKTEEKQSPTEQLDAITQKFIQPTTGETWLDSPKELPDQGFIPPIDGNGPSDIKYYEVGARNGSTIIMSVEPAPGDIIFLYEKSPSGEVSAIVRPDAQAVYNEENETYYTSTFAKTVKVDKTTHYDSLTVPAKFPTGDGYDLTQQPYGFSLGNFTSRTAAAQSPPTITLVKQYGKTKLEKYVYKYPDTGLSSISYLLTLPTHTQYSLVFQPIETSVKGYQFSRGDSAINDTDEFVAITRGCGSIYASVSRADTITDADVTAVGKSSSGNVIYELTSSNHPLINKAYDEFVEFNKVNINGEFPDGISKDDYIKQHALILFKDKNNQWLAYVRQKLRPYGGCAKPVVYLYPETAQNISVKVGANVKVSDPYYNPLFGWSNVWATPSGKLSVAGQTYDSLFWEGPGEGEYPIINKGVVVKTSEAIATIKSQLKQQGLNSKEIADFVEYWEPNLPEKPYVRLTWLNTDDMNKLAPLNISPKPDTLIRVFLDFAGLDKPVVLEPQNLQAIPRQGFTAVEWGGLSAKKLY